VRIPNPRLVRLGGISKGAIVEPGDGNLLVPAVLQPSIELSAPVDKVFISPVVAQVEDSFMVYDTQTQVGAVGGVNRNIVSFARGLWSFDLTFCGMFTGTTNVAGGDDCIQMVDPDGAAMVFFLLPRITGAQQSAQVKMNVAFQRDGWKFAIVTFATVAADALRILSSINARRLV
jgi:hypothetical protein